MIITEELSREELKEQRYFEKSVGIEGITLTPNEEAFALVVIAVVEEYLSKKGMTKNG